VNKLDAQAAWLSGFPQFLMHDGQRDAYRIFLDTADERFFGMDCGREFGKTSFWFLIASSFANVMPKFQAGAAFPELKHAQDALFPVVVVRLKGTNKRPYAVCTEPQRDCFFVCSRHHTLASAQHAARQALLVTDAADEDKNLMEDCA